MAKKKPLQKNTVIQEPKKLLPHTWALQRPVLWLALSVLAVYAISLGFRLTELDDTIFMRELRPYYEDMGNLITSFQRGLFHPTNDMYYRPLFMDVMLLNYQLAGDNIMVFHLINILLHLGAVLLLFTLLKKLGLKEIHAFILSLVFAVHPVLSQAVAWIPGRNDTMLSVFTLSFFIFSINYANDNKLKWLLLSALMLLCAFFTKETAMFNAPVAFILLVGVMKRKWLDRSMLIQYVVWIATFVAWYIVRANATLKWTYTDPHQISSDFIHHLPALVQYIGKVIFPFNLNVFPIIQDTTYYYGIAAIVVLVVIVYLSKSRNMHIVWAGLAIFILFLLPALLVPNKMNDQAFEHRLYLPMLGILLVLSQTNLLKNNVPDKQLLYRSLIIIAILAVLNINHQQYFKDPLSFWKKAADESPHSAYATMMLGERLTDDLPQAYALLRRSYQMDSTEKYINYFYGMMLQNEDSLLQSEKYFLAEKRISGFAECDFLLAKIAFFKKDYKNAQTYLETYLKVDSTNQMAHNNLLILYIQEHEYDKAHTELQRMQQIGLKVEPALIDSVKSH